jgi:predicted Zn-dependent peptidase
MGTQRETLRQLCKSIITKLENHKAITLPARLRQVVQDEVFGLIGPFVLTDEDLRDKTLAKIGAKADLLEDSKFTDSEQFRAAKAVVRKLLGHFQKSPKYVANSIVQYLMRSSHIDDVYETDEDLEHQIVELVQKFNPNDLH